MYGRERENGMHIRRADVLLILFFLLLTTGIFAVFLTGQREGRTLTISCGGEVLESVTLSGTGFSEAVSGDGKKVRYCLLLFQEDGVLSEWYETRPEIPEETDYNLLCISGEGVWMEAADCRDQICVHHEPITGGGESIICLPHRLAVEIRGDAGENGLDGMVK